MSGKAVLDVLLELAVRWALLMLVGPVEGKVLWLVYRVTKELAQHRRLSWEVARDIIVALAFDMFF